MSAVTVHTIGFTRKTAEIFFTLLKNARVTRLLDIRLNNSSQLAGYTKKEDLAFLTRAVLGIEYQHLVELAPTQQLLDRSRKQGGTWEEYERDFLALMRARKIENLPRPLFDSACLLCSEQTPEHCHRRLVAEYLRDAWGDIQIDHL